ncbi:MAG: YeeE/YedE family protein [Phycisphaerales bacterium]|nr:MAG: YeeE/YedE family protein [Phycisphaerales bacterium]
MFDTPYFASLSTLALGAVTGLVFGFLLQRGGATRYTVILNQFLLRDFTVLKIMLTGMIVGGVGVYAMLQLGMIEHLHVKGATLLANALGGLIFGAGMAIAGYCPGSGVAAIGDGSRHAIFSVLGMIVGAGVYAETQPWMAKHVLPVLDEGRITLSSATGLSPWWFMIAMAVVAAAGFVALERWERTRHAPAAT